MTYEELEALCIPHGVLETQGLISKPYQQVFPGGDTDDVRPTSRTFDRVYNLPRHVDAALVKEPQTLYLQVWGDPIQELDYSLVQSAEDLAGLIITTARLLGHGDEGGDDDV